MTLNQLMELAGRHPGFLLALFLGLPLAAWIFGRLHGPHRGGLPPWRYVYAVLAYLACVPGIVATVLVAYQLFFTETNLLELNVWVYFLPPIAMVATLSIAGRQVDFDHVPGFDRLFGLMVMIAVSFTIALVLQKTHIWVVFGASIFHLFVLALIAFLLLKWASHKLMAGKSSRPRP